MVSPVKIRRYFLCAHLHKLLKFKKKQCLHSTTPPGAGYMPVNEQQREAVHAAADAANVAAKAVDVVAVATLVAELRNVKQRLDTIESERPRAAAQGDKKVKTELDVRATKLRRLVSRLISRALVMRPVPRDHF